MAEQKERELPRWAVRGLLALVLVFAAIVFLAGIRRDLPLIQEIDEPLFVGIGLRVAATGNLNPGWFGHPGSTLIYPLAAADRLWDRVGSDPPPAGARSTLYERAERAPETFFLIGRLVSVAYAILAVPLVFSVARRAFDELTALGSTWLAVLPVVALDHAQMARTDAPGVFFVLLGLWRCLVLVERPGYRNQALAGLAIGLAIATRYFLAALVPLLVVVDLIGVRERRDGAWVAREAPRAALGLLCVGLGFALSTPYFLLDHGAVVASIGHEARDRHPGSDGLDFGGNLLWYAALAIPSSLTWPVTALAAAGALLAALRLARGPLLLLFFVAVFLVGISLSPLHEQRWVIQLLPVFAMFAAWPIVEIARALGRRAGAPSIARAAALLAIGLISVAPCAQLAGYLRARQLPSTRLVARQWVIGHLPRDSAIEQEPYGVPLAGTGLRVVERPTLAEGTPLAERARAGGRYLVASSWIYQRYLAEPARYPAEVAFYASLFSRAHLLAEFAPGTTMRGPVVRIYDLLG
jgi:4-amino-4-deoxy-L-arabinose transferase-like glycosyltransferase